LVSTPQQSSTTSHTQSDESNTDLNITAPSQSSTSDDVRPSTSTPQQSSSRSHKRVVKAILPDQITSKSTVRMAIKNNLKVYTIAISATDLDPIICIQSNATLISSILLENLHEMNHGLKWYINVNVEFSRITAEGEIQTTTSNFNGKNRILHDDSDIDPNFQESMAKVLSSIKQFE